MVAEKYADSARKATISCPNIANMKAFSRFHVPLLAGAFANWPVTSLGSGGTHSRLPCRRKVLLRGVGPSRGVQSPALPGYTLGNVWTRSQMMLVWHFLSAWIRPVSRLFPADSEIWQLILQNLFGKPASLKLLPLWDRWPRNETNVFTVLQLQIYRLYTLSMKHFCAANGLRSLFFYFFPSQKELCIDRNSHSFTSYENAWPCFAGAVAIRKITSWKCITTPS